MAEPITYTTLDGDVIDLTDLAPHERAFFDECYVAYRDNVVPFGAFLNLVHGDRNPALEPGRRVTRAVAAHPLYRSVRDLEDRVGIAQQALRPGPDDLVDRDPLDDELIPHAQVAERLGVSLGAVYQAVERGDLVATAGRPSRVSGNSLRHWQVHAGKQHAGRVSRQAG